MFPISGVLLEMWDVVGGEWTPIRLTEAIPITSGMEGVIIRLLGVRHSEMLGREIAWLEDHTPPLY